MWGRFTKSGLQLESVLQEPLCTDVCKTWVSAVAFLVSSHSWTTDSVRSISPGLKTKRTGLLLSGPKLCSLMKVRGEAQNPRCLRSSVKFPQSLATFTWTLFASIRMNSFWLSNPNVVFTWTPNKVIGLMWAFICHKLLIGFNRLTCAHRMNIQFPAVVAYCFKKHTWYLFTSGPN